MFEKLKKRFTRTSKEPTAYPYTIGIRKSDGSKLVFCCNKEALDIIVTDYAKSLSKNTMLHVSIGDKSYRLNPSHIIDIESTERG